jgi:membrane-bound lytic murein transglycosylase D
MKKQLNQLRRFFARTGPKRLNAATAREAIPASYDDDDGSNRLSGAFVVVLLLHVIALIGVFTFSRMKDPKSGSGSADAAARNLAKTQPAVAPAVESAEAAAALPEPETTREPVRETAQESVPSTSSRSGGRSWIVKSGETLSKIAFAHNVRTADLKAANNLKTDEIRAGQELIIPENRTSRAAAEVKAAVKVPEKATTAVRSNGSTYTVKKNDALVKIAREQGVKYEELIKLNNIKDPRKIQEGQVLKLPKKS